MINDKTVVTYGYIFNWKVQIKESSEYMRSQAEIIGGCTKSQTKLTLCENVIARRLGHAVRQCSKANQQVHFWMSQNVFVFFCPFKIRT